ncbi:UPF0161 protein [Platanthera zijinensis]|uniref:UPF0161 protein n=1 Tax=Platanthera zijinensis TaxID=2320716 RepID=A0AAP0BMF3_9ASPA
MLLQLPLLTLSNPKSPSSFPQILNFRCNYAAGFTLRSTRTARRRNSARGRSRVNNATNEDSSDEESSDMGVRAALSMLKFYKREISPILPSSCRYVPTCSVYSMEAYKRYGVAKGTILTIWRLCRCNPIGGNGFDPPRWFGEENGSDEC